MRARCSKCSAISETSLPILLVVCACGNLLRFRPDPSDLATSPHESVEIDHYKTLGLTRPVTDEQVRSKYRERVKTCHPDYGGDAAEFDLVTVAYKALLTEDKRRQYDEALSAGRFKTLTMTTVPDLVAKRATEIADVLADIPIAVQVIIVPVDGRDRRARRVIGQYPTPGSRVDAGSLMAVVLALPRSSTVWQQVKAYAADVAVSFLDGFLRGGGSGAARPALTAGDQTLGAQLAGTVGEVTGATVKAGVGVASCLLRAYAVMFGLFVTAILLWLAPPLGILALVIVVWLAIRSSMARSERKKRGLWY